MALSKAIQLTFNAALGWTLRGHKPKQPHHLAQCTDRLLIVGRATSGPKEFLSLPFIACGSLGCLGWRKAPLKGTSTKNSKARRTWSKIVGGYERPFPSLRFLLCLAQRSLPLFAGVVLSALLCKDGVGNFEDAMGRAMETGCIAGTVKAPLRWGFADWAKEGSGQRSILT
jgi:hypothetical protein